jgi:hypothetical protein
MPPAPRRREITLYKLALAGRCRSVTLQQALMKYEFRVAPVAAEPAKSALTRQAAIPHPRATIVRKSRLLDRR